MYKFWPALTPQGKFCKLTPFGFAKKSAQLVHQGQGGGRTKRVFLLQTSPGAGSCGCKSYRSDTVPAVAMFMAQQTTTVNINNFISFGLKLSKRLNPMNFANQFIYCLIFFIFQTHYYRKSRIILEMFAMTELNSSYFICIICLTQTTR